MKQALYYAIRRNYGDSVVAVTSIKGTRRWHGRDTQHNETTHGTFDQLYGRFDSQEAAESARTRVRAIGVMFTERRKVHETAIATLRREERDTIESFIKETTVGN